MPAHIFERRPARHVIFWACWVLGFTFIKSFDGSTHDYLSWFAYYIMTLPLFVCHTYLVAYVLIPWYSSRTKLPLFIFWFLLAFVLFSIMELLLSQELVFRWFPVEGELQEDYLAPANIVRNGLGNLYIILVFIASKTIRDWSKSTLKQKELLQGALKEQLEETMLRVQPMMLIFAIDHIDRMVEEEAAGVSRAIALTSELLSEVMMYHEEGEQWISREIELVRKLVDLVSVLKGTAPDVEFFISGDPADIKLPPMILFSFVDLLFRKFDPIPEINIEVSGFSGMINIQVMCQEDMRREGTLEDCMNAIARLKQHHGDRVDIATEHHVYGCSVLIRATYHDQHEEYPAETVAP